MVPKISVPQAELKIVEYLGHGLNSCVYKAIKENREFGIQQEYAVKILNSKNLKDIWRSEIERISAIRSKYCVCYFGWEVLESGPAIIFEYIRGVTLESLLKNNSLVEEEVHFLYAQVLQGLNDLKDVGMCHGDLSPHNIMIDVMGNIKLVDFGLYDNEGTLFITPKYASPELLNGKRPSYETDLYSLRAIAEDINRRSNLKIVSFGASYESQQKGQKLIAVKAQELYRMRKHQLAVTQKLNFLSKRIESRIFKIRDIVIAICFGLMCTLYRGDMSVAEQTGPKAILSVRSNIWVSIYIDDVDYGYAPVDIQLKANRKINVKWKTPFGTGTWPLTPQAGEHIVLTEEQLRGH